MITILRRASAGLSLAPAQRASLKAAKSVAYIVLAFLFSGQGAAAVNAALQPGANVGAIVHSQLLVPILLVILLTLDKYLTAQKDAPLSSQSPAAGQSGQQPAAAPAEALSAPSSAPAAATVPDVPADAQPIGAAGGPTA